MIRRWIGLSVVVGVKCLFLCTLMGCGGEATSTEALSVSKVDQALAAGKRLGMHVRTSPTAKVDSTAHDFGVMEANTDGKHVFRIKNTGSAPLTLKLGDTSCQCTSVLLDVTTVPPQETAEVTVNWNTRDKSTAYMQWAQIVTDDPQHEQLTFTIRGQVRQLFQMHPEELQFGNVLPTETKRLEVLVFSQKIADFELGSLATGNPDFQVTAVAATAEQLQTHKALHGYVVSITTPTNLPKGNFSDWLSMQVKHGEDRDQTQQLEVPLQGAMRGKLVILGPDINDFGHIEFGTLSYGKGAKASLKVRVRDDDPRLNVQRIVVDPKFLQVKFTPSTNSATPDMYDLTIEVPRDAEPCGYRGDAMATMRIEFDHPRIKDLNLLVDFSVRPPRSYR